MEGEKRDEGWKDRNHRLGFPIDSHWELRESNPLTRTPPSLKKTLK